MELRLASTEKAPAAGQGGAGTEPGRCCCGVAWAGAHQGLAVAAGDRAQGVALVEVVYEAHAAAQHRAGAQEVGDHLLLADAAVPVRGKSGGGPQLRGASLGPPTTRLTQPTGKSPTNLKVITGLLTFDLPCGKEKEHQTWSPADVPAASN